MQVLFEDRQPPCRVANATPAAIEVGLFLPARDKLGELQLGKPLHTVVVQADRDAGLAADQNAAEGKFMTLLFSQIGIHSCHASCSWQGMCLSVVLVHQWQPALASQASHHPRHLLPCPACLLCDVMQSFLHGLLSPCRTPPSAPFSPIHLCSSSCRQMCKSACGRSLFGITVLFATSRATDSKYLAANLWRSSNVDSQAAL